MWVLTTKFDPACCALANRHYPATNGRRRIGSPQWLPPGRTVALRTPECDAAWGTVQQEYRRDEWAGAWINTFFRNESEWLSSEMILAALAVSRHQLGEPDEKGVVTFIDTTAIRRKRDPGRCYRKAGFEIHSRTNINDYLVLRLPPELVPAAAPAISLQGQFEGVGQ